MENSNNEMQEFADEFKKALSSMLQNGCTYGCIIGVSVLGVPLAIVPWKWALGA